MEKDSGVFLTFAELRTTEIGKYLVNRGSWKLQYFIYLKTKKHWSGINPKGWAKSKSGVIFKPEVTSYHQKGDWISYTCPRLHVAQSVNRRYKSERGNGRSPDHEDLCNQTFQICVRSVFGFAVERLGKNVPDSSLLPVSSRTPPSSRPGRWEEGGDV